MVSRGVRVTCDFLEAGRFVATLTSPAASTRRLHLGRRSLTLATVAGPVDEDAYWIRLRPKARYRKALRAARRATLVVKVRGWNAAGSDSESARITFTR